MADLVCDRVNYFTTSAPGAGIFVPISKAVRRDSPSGYPTTPGGIKGSASVNFASSPTPAVPKFSASVGPGARAASPQGKRPPRTSLPRPDSPVRRTQMTPGPRPSIPSTSPSKGPANRFAQSVRGTAGDPSKKPSKLDLRSGQRSTSAMGGPMNFDEEPPLPTQTPRANGTNGLSASVSAFNLRRPASRANQANDEEIERLKSQLEDKDRQLKEQSATLGEMESSLVELQGLIETNQNSPQNNDNNRNSMDDKDTTQLRALLREKTDKIAMLTSEFDAHRADFRSTIDTLELASTETERVYEKRIEELVGELRELESRNLDVDSVASQLKQLEELVQELEEGLEDARRGEAEARGEAEFLRGEVERTRTELQRAKSGDSTSNGSNGASVSSHEKDLAQKEDEIRGLKAIIHSLSRDSVPGSGNGDASDGAAGNGKPGGGGSLERQISELQSLLNKKNTREEELEHELEYLRRGNNQASNNHSNPSSNQRSSLRDSRDTVIPARSYETRSPELAQRKGNTLDTMHENDMQSNATTDASALWCEICETSGHDILTCTNMFGPDGASAAGGGNANNDNRSNWASHSKPPLSPDFTGARPAPLAPLSPTRSKSATESTGPLNILPNPMESGPVAGKESGVMDPEKWCAVCERDGHDSVDCPFEDAF